MLSFFRRRRRAIFRFHDGRRWRRADPLRIWRDIWNDAGCNLDRDFPDMVDGDLEATERVVALARKAFQVKTLENGGLTEMESVELLADLLDYMGGLKKSTNTPQTTSPPTDSGSSVASPTNAPSDSFSTPPAPNDAEPCDC